MMRSGRFVGYNPEAFRNDCMAGLIVGIIAIPLGMAFAIASGVEPEYGIYSIVVGGILISLFGGSRFQIGGPTGAFIPILLAIVMQYGYENLLIAGFLAGAMLVLMGLLRLGTLIKYIPRPVTVGFTAGIAVVIFTGQIAGFLGLRDVGRTDNVVSNLIEIGRHLGTTNGYAVIVACISLTVALVASKMWPKVPGSLAGLIVSGIVAILFFEGKVETIQSVYGSIPNTFPPLQLPDLSWERIQPLLRPALVIAMLGGIESLLSAVVADGMTGSQHNSNRELIGQGIANMVVPLFGGIPVTGAIARTAANIRNGAVSPVSGVVHGLTVLLVMAALAPVTSHIPLASMAPVLMIVAWNMSERHEFIRILRMRTNDSAVLLVTFVLTVVADLTVAVEVGLVLAVLLFVKRMSDIQTVAKVLPDHTARHAKVKPHMVTEDRDCPRISIYTIEGPLFFGAADMLEASVLGTSGRKPEIVLLRMGKVPFMDATGEAILARVIGQIQRNGRIVLISGLRPQPREMMRRTGLDRIVGERHIFEHTGEAIDCALAGLDAAKCMGCRRFAFRECEALSAGAVHSRNPAGHPTPSWGGPPRTVPVTK